MDVCAIGVLVQYCQVSLPTAPPCLCRATRRSSGASKAQRGGRAGRVAPGAALRTVTAAAAASHPPFDPPELLRASLDRPLLRMTAHMAHLGTPAQLLAATPQPPEATRVEAALAQLRATGCLTATGPHLHPHNHCEHLSFGFTAPKTVSHLVGIFV